MKPVFYNKIGLPVFDAHKPEGDRNFPLRGYAEWADEQDVKKLEVECHCNEDFHKHICFHECPEAIKYDGLPSNLADWQG